MSQKKAKLMRSFCEKHNLNLNVLKRGYKALPHPDKAKLSLELEYLKGGVR